MVTQNEWRSKAAGIFNGIILITLMGIARTVVNYIGDLNDMGNFMDMVDGRGYDFSPDQWDIMGYLAGILIIVGYSMYLSGLGHFSNLQVEEDRHSVLKVRSGVIWSLIAIIIDYIPFIGGVLCVIFNLIAFILMLGGFSRLKHSATFPKAARRGAGTLHSSMIVGLIGVILGAIPVVGALPEGILSTIAFFMMLSGWATIKNTLLQPTDALNLDYAMSANAPYSPGPVESVRQSPVSPDLRTKIACKADTDLEHILANPDEYNATFVQAAREEKESRERHRQAEAAKTKVINKTDDELTGILANREEYSSIFIAAAQEELNSRRARKEAEEKRLAEERAREKEASRYAPGNNSRLEEEATPAQSQETAASASPAATAITVSQPTTEPKTPVVPPAPSRKGSGGLIAGIIIGILLIAGILSYIFWYVPYAKDRDALRTYVYATNLFLRSSPMAGVEYNIITKIPYGAELITYTKNSEWAEIKFNDQKGYVASTHILEQDDFNLLNNAWGNTDARECIVSSKCRNAILNYLKTYRLQSGNNGWQLYTKEKDQKPNSVYYPRLYNKSSKFTDFAFIIKDNISGGRRLVIYSFEDETEAPIFRTSVSNIPIEGYIESMNPTYYGKIAVKFTGGESFTLDKE